MPRNWGLHAQPFTKSSRLKTLSVSFRSVGLQTPFTEAEKQHFDTTAATAKAEVDAKYQPEIDAQTKHSKKIIQDAAVLLIQAKPLGKAQQGKLKGETLQKRLAEIALLQPQVPELRERIKHTQSALDTYLKEMDEKKRIEARELLKERFDYPIFMYEAERVGISATGEEDQNELYPNTSQPSNCEKTCLEWYREFQANPASLAETEGAE